MSLPTIPFSMLLYHLSSFEGKELPSLKDFICSASFPIKLHSKASEEQKRPVKGVQKIVSSISASVLAASIYLLDTETPEALHTAFACPIPICSDANCQRPSELLAVLLSRHAKLIPGLHFLLLEVSARSTRAVPFRCRPFTFQMRQLVHVRPVKECLVGVF